MFLAFAPASLAAAHRLPVVQHVLSRSPEVTLSQKPFSFNYIQKILQPFALTIKNR